uniref:START domain-containing protein n=1 Tax=Periophthalmus magnuspinnatus TaxID=409849 RepID=A0A3B4AXH1_9GOBI
MLPALVKLCCGISYPHLRSMAGLQRAAVAVIGQEISHLNTRRPPHVQTHLRFSTEEQSLYEQQGRGAMETALSVIQDRDGWKTEVTERDGDVICSKVLRGNRRVFKLEAELDATVEQLHHVLFVRVEDMHRWNPSIQAEDGPTCFILEPIGPNRSKFTWLLNLDVKGWLPKSVVNQALPRAQLDFTRHLRRHLSTGGALQGEPSR